MPESLLELEGVEARYGPVKALHGVSLTVAEGEIVAVLGANGAGKTTTLRAISGTVGRSGAIRFAGNSIAGRSPESVARLGIAHVPEGRGTLSELSVAENLRLGAYVRRDRAGIREDERRVLGRFPWLDDRRGQRAGTLSGGEQQMLATARALCARPVLLLMDEPSEGLMPTLVDRLLGTVAALRARGVGILLVEQKVDAVLRVADRVAILEGGRVVHQATPAELSAEPDLLLRYVGVRR
jgi:branched-chain amino acid transport system ATP-binding protein